MDISIKIGGEAGQGIQTIGGTLASVFARTGYHVFTHQDYESRVRGGHNFFQIRFSDAPVMSSRDKIDILVAMDRESISFHEKELSEYGRIIYDSAALKQKHDKPRFLDIPLVDLSVEHGGSRIMAGTVAVGGFALMVERLSLSGMTETPVVIALAHRPGRKAAALPEMQYLQRPAWKDSPCCDRHKTLQS